MKNTGKVKLAIKATFNNRINRILNPNPRKGQFLYEVRQNINNLTEKQKAELLDRIVTEYLVTSNELRSYGAARKERKQIQKLRDAKIANGNRPAKRKTSKAEWEAMQADEKNVVMFGENFTPVNQKAA